MELYLLGYGSTVSSENTMNITAKLSGNTHGETGAFVKMKGNFGNTFSRWVADEFTPDGPKYRVSGNGYAYAANFYKDKLA